MKLLAIDTSSKAASVAVISDNELIGEYTIINNQNHSIKLLPMIDQILDNLSLDISEINFFAVANGPGSFTGLRIGVATVNGLAQALNRPVIGVSILDGLAYNFIHFDGLVAPILDARREQVYTAIYSTKEHKLERITDYLAIPILELVEFVKNKEVLLTGDGLNQTFIEIIKENLGEKAIFPPKPLINRNIAGIAAIAYEKALAGSYLKYNQLQPFYIRQSQAERNLVI